MGNPTNTVSKSHHVRTAHGTHSTARQPTWAKGPKGKHLGRGTLPDGTVVYRDVLAGKRRKAGVA